MRALIPAVAEARLLSDASLQTVEEGSALALTTRLWSVVKIADTSVDVVKATSWFEPTLLIRHRIAGSLT